MLACNAARPASLRTRGLVLGRIDGQRQVGELRLEFRFGLLELLGRLAQLGPGVGKVLLPLLRVAVARLRPLDQLLRLFADQFARRHDRHRGGGVVRVLFEKLRQVPLRLLHQPVALPRSESQVRGAGETLRHLQLPYVSQLIRQVPLVGQRLQILDRHVAVAVLLEGTEKRHRLPVRCGRPLRAAAAARTTDKAQSPAAQSETRRSVRGRIARGPNAGGGVPTPLRGDGPDSCVSKWDCPPQHSLAEHNSVQARLPERF